jgi:Flp pilus assembly protein TadD
MDPSGDQAPVEPTKEAIDTKKGRRSKKSALRRIVSDVPIRLGDLASGLPALILAILALTPVAWARFASGRDKLYLTEAQDRVRKGDFAGAAVCYKRLATFQPAIAEYRFAMAIALEQSGEPARAEGIIRSLVPENRRGLPLAEFWLGCRLLIDPNGSEARKASGEIHLKRFLDPDNTNLDPKLIRECKALLGSYYADTGRLREARSYLQQSAGKPRPDLLLKLSYVCKGLKDDAEANRVGIEAQKALAQYVEQHPGDQEALLLLVKAYATLGDFAGAIDLMNQSAKKFSEERWRNSMAALHVSWAESLLKQGSSGRRELFQVIEEGLRYDPKNRWLLSQLNNVLNKDDEGSDDARNLLRSMLASGKGVGVAHFALGTDAWRHGRKEEARIHWEQASQLEAASPEIANNLAYLLAFEEPTDLPRAIELVTKTLATAPPQSKPLLHGTLGEILCKQGKWNEAVSELELALKGGEDTPGLHGSLAEAYTKLGMEDMAREHRNRSRPASPLSPRLTPGGATTPRK